MRRRRLALGVLALGATLAGPAGAELPELAPPRSPAAPSGLEELEGRGPGPPGSAAAVLGADTRALRFAAPAGGSASLVVYLAPQPRGTGRPWQSVALASLLGVPGEIRLDARPARAPLEPRPPAAGSGPEPVPEPSPLALGLGGLLLLGRLARGRASCHPARRWSGPPRG
jgi:hypothetical protein